jgi:hypothetical protein
MDAARTLADEATDCSDPNAILRWCEKAHSHLSNYLNDHESLRLHQGDEVCYIIAKGVHRRAHECTFCPPDLVRFLLQPICPPGLQANWL